MEVVVVVMEEFGVLVEVEMLMGALSEWWR